MSQRKCSIPIAQMCLRPTGPTEKQREVLQDDPAAWGAADTQTRLRGGLSGSPRQRAQASAFRETRAHSPQRLLRGGCSGNSCRVSERSCVRFPFDPVSSCSDLLPAFSVSLHGAVFTSSCAVQVRTRPMTRDSLGPGPRPGPEQVLGNRTPKGRSRDLSPQSLPGLFHHRQKLSSLDPSRCQ